MLIISSVCDPHVSASPNWILLPTLPFKEKNHMDVTCVYKPLTVREHDRHRGLGFLRLCEKLRSAKEFENNEVTVRKDG